MLVPSEIISVIEGRPVAGTLDQAFVLLTVDAEGVPDVCLLSRAEIESDDREVRMVIASRKARSNLGRSVRGTLIVVVNGVPNYLALVRRATVEGRGALGVAATVTRVIRDDIGVELHPMTFRVDEQLEVVERWEHSEALFEELRRLADKCIAAPPKAPDRQGR